MNPVARKLQNWPLALALFGGVGLVISFLAPIFTTSTRWALILAVLIFTLARPRALGWLRSSTGIFLIISMAWALLTYFWSLQPLLTVMKAVAFTLVVVALVSAGYRWVLFNGIRNALSFLFPLMVASLLAGVLGRTEAETHTAGTGMDLYRGLAGNSNMFGSLMFMISPFLLWQFHLGRGRPRVQLLWGAMLALAFSMLLLSVARSSILAMALLVAAYGFALPLARRTSLLFFGGLAISTVLLMSPGALDKLSAKYVRKNLTAQNTSIFFSRETPWEISLNMAKQGGWLGAGYGVSIDGGSFRSGLTAVGYGREKGNTQLAIMEETGIVGLALHVLIVVSVLGRMWRAFRAATDPNLKVLTAIVMGALLGEVVIGVFEAWWVAPGAPESIWFWTMVGVGLALVDLARPSQSYQEHRPSPATTTRTRFRRGNAWR